MPALRRSPRSPRPRSLALAALVVTFAAASPARAVSIKVKSASSPAPGVRVEALELGSPTARAWVTYVDLCADVRVDATTAPGGLETAGAWGSSVGATLATNGDFYKTGPVRVYGPAVGEGAAWPSINTGVDAAYAGEWYYDRFGWIAFGRGWVEVNHTEWVKKHPQAYPTREGWRPEAVTHALPPGTTALVSGFPELVVEGKQVTCPSPTASSCFPDRSDMRDRHPRTAMGITEDRRTFMLLVVDGRTNVSAGLYGAELAEVMAKLGAWTAFNLDGGGSSQLWVAGEGYLNDTSGNNSGGGTRAVANHWGVFAGAGVTAPGHCVDDLVEGLLAPAVGQEASTTDVDGDGRADACIRGEDGVRCAMGATPGEDALLVDLADEGGWGDLANATTLRMGDVDGDGLADLCARANAGVRCWLSDPAPLATAIAGPPLADEAGWDEPRYFSTIRLADVTGDGLDDLCGRAAAGLRCWPSTGAGFGPVITSGAFADAAGFADPSRYPTLRFGDVDGDGRADACGRGEAGMECWLASEEGFSGPIAGPEWSDAKGWSKAPYWATIRLGDVDGDGRADLCGRAAAGFRCHLSTGTGFGEAICGAEGAILADADGGAAPAVYSTIRLGDVDGDGDLDVCGRTGAAFACWPWEAGGFAAALAGPAAAADEWVAPRVYASPRLADVDGDGRADLCRRGAAGLRCDLSTGTGFSEGPAGPGWGGAGWESPAVYGTLMLGGPRCVATPELCNGVDDDCDGVIDDACDDGAQTSGEGSSGGASSGGDSGGGSGGGSGEGASGEGSSSGASGSAGASEVAGCACRGGSGGGEAPLAALVVAMGRRRRARAGAVSRAARR